MLVGWDIQQFHTGAQHKGTTLWPLISGQVCNLVEQPPTCQAIGPGRILAMGGHNLKSNVSWGSWQLLSNSAHFAKNDW